MSEKHWKINQTSVSKYAIFKVHTVPKSGQNRHKVFMDLLGAVKCLNTNRLPLSHILYHIYQTTFCIRNEVKKIVKWGFLTPIIINEHINATNN